MDLEPKRAEYTQSIRSIQQQVFNQDLVTIDTSNRTLKLPKSIKIELRQLFWNYMNVIGYQILLNIN